MAPVPSLLPTSFSAASRAQAPAVELSRLQRNVTPLCSTSVSSLTYDELLGGEFDFAVLVNGALSASAFRYARFDDLCFRTSLWC